MSAHTVSSNTVSSNTVSSNTVSSNTVSSKRAALLAARAGQLRREATFSEQVLWAELRQRKLGVEFRRQVVVGGKFIADFVAPACGLIVEVDGLYHARRVAADARRERVLRRLGFRVLRVSEQEVLGELALVLERIRRALKDPG
jgi:very-short-patch-repair endonuclease